MRDELIPYTFIRCHLSEKFTDKSYLS